MGLSYSRRYAGERRREIEQTERNRERVSTRLLVAQLFWRIDDATKSTGRDTARDHCIHVQTQTDVEWLSEFLTHLGHEYCRAIEETLLFFRIYERAASGECESSNWEAPELSCESWTGTTGEIKLSPWVSWLRRKWVIKSGGVLSPYLPPDDDTWVDVFPSAACSIPSSRFSFFLFPPTTGCVPISFRVQRV